MDRLLGHIIDDYHLYRIIQTIIVMLSLSIVYLGIQIALTWKFLKKEKKDDVIFKKSNFIRSSVFISITGIFMLSHEFFEGLEDFAPDETTYELLELIAFTGLVLFFYEWYNILNKIKKGS